MLIKGGPDSTRDISIHTAKNLKACDDVITWKRFPQYCSFVRRTAGHWRLPIKNINAHFRCTCYITAITLHWRHNEPDGVSNHQLRDCLLNCLFRCGSKKTSKLRVTGLCAENWPGAGEFSAQKASNAENVSIWWRHHVRCLRLNRPSASTVTAKVLSVTLVSI